jgi:hypothetical protein
MYESRKCFISIYKGNNPDRVIRSLIVNDMDILSLFSLFLFSHWRQVVVRLTSPAQLSKLVLAFMKWKQLTK